MSACWSEQGLAWRSTASEIACPSGVIKKYSHSTPVLSSYPRLASASAITRLSTWRGFCSTGFPAIARSPVTQATSGFHGNWIRLSCSGITSTSGSAGVMSNQVAKPAKPAPDLATLSIALAGTILARMVPNRSTKAIRKYRMPFCSAISLQRGIVVPPVSPGLSRNPFRSRERHARHRGGFHAQRHEILRFEVVDVALAAGARDGLRLERKHGEVIRELAPGDDGIEPRRERRVLGRDARGIAPLMPIIVSTGRGPERAVFFLERRIVVAERNQRGGADRDRVRAERQALRDVRAGANAA